jgi:hypothetical protein
MNKNQLRKSIVISIILLLIGVSVSSAVSVDTKSTISNNQREECRECNEVSDADLIRVERLLNRVEVYSKLLSVLGKYNPELREMSEELSDEITTLNDLYEELNLHQSSQYIPIVCEIVESIMTSLGNILIPVYELINRFYGNEIIRNILISISLVLAGIGLPFMMFYEAFCADYPF